MEIHPVCQNHRQKNAKMDELLRLKQYNYLILLILTENVVNNVTSVSGDSEKGENMSTVLDQIISHLEFLGYEIEQREGGIIKANHQLHLFAFPLYYATECGEIHITPRPNLE